MAAVTPQELHPGEQEKPLIPQLALSEIVLGRLVGQGGFSMVCTIDEVKLDEVFDTGEKESQSRLTFANSLKENTYVLKILRTDLPEEEHIKGIVDLAIEADFLKVLHHPNIISMQAMSNSDPYESRFFVVLDRLSITLDWKFTQWNAEVSESKGFWLGPCGYCCSKKQFLYQTWVERITAARDIANAIYYLHSKRIVYRDLKPDNLGFDATGTLKLFDFGLAKDLDPTLQTPDGMFHLTGNTGSLRYMAPEVALGEPYDQRVDSYSFGILFWQLCTLQTPYAGHNAKSHAERVVRLGHRPPIQRSWPAGWIDMMNRAWCQDKRARPDFDEIVVFFDEQVKDLLDHAGEVPNPSLDQAIRAKKASERLDVDTRISTNEDKTTKRFENNVV
eukprot:Nitzschia sp. Nitz4//scaffold126_size65214//59948//61181//NITZ4_006168-RA/size65214-snap-gene-0.59-mRNA-1//-1//CDS//3329534725//3297//frame0